MKPKRIEFNHKTGEVLIYGPKIISDSVDLEPILFQGKIDYFNQDEDTTTILLEQVVSPKSDIDPFPNVDIEINRGDRPSILDAFRLFDGILTSEEPTRLQTEYNRS